MSVRPTETKVAMVTGASRGIGLAICRALGTAGYRVAMCDVLVEEGENAAADLSSAGVDATFYPLDVRSTEEVNRTVDEITQRLGRLDLGVNNAGVRAVAKTADLCDEDWERVIDVNLNGVFRCTRAQVPHMLMSGGNIVNIASIWGLAGWPTRSAYVAAKHGVVGLTRTAAREYGEQGLRVNAVAPGPIDTSGAMSTIGSTSPELRDVVARTAVGKLGRAEDIADAVLWLASASYVTGEVLAVDGGWGA